MKIYSGKVLLLLAISLALAPHRTGAVKTVVHGDVCQSFSGRKVYLEPGTSALLYATNLTTRPQYGARIRSDVNKVNDVTIPDAVFWSDPAGNRASLSQQFNLRRRKMREFGNSLPQVSPKATLFDAPQLKRELSHQEDGHQSFPGVGNPAKTDVVSHELSVTIPSQKGAGLVHAAGGRAVLNDEEHAIAPQPFPSNREQHIMRQKQLFIQKSFRNDATKDDGKEISERSDEASHMNQLPQLQNPSQDSSKTRADIFSSNRLQLSSLKPSSKLNTVLDQKQSEIPPDHRILQKSWVRQHQNLPDDQLPKNPALMSQESTNEKAPSDHQQTSELEQCGLDIYTCSGCHLHFSFQEVHLPSCSHDHSCRCDYLRVREPPYLQSGGGLDVCGDFGGSTGASARTSAGLAPTEYTSLTKEATLQLLFRNPHVKAFSVVVTALRNSFLISSATSPQEGYVRSPFFPELYPKDYWVEYIFTDINQTRKVQITFEDYNLSPWSFIEVHDNQRIHLAGFSGTLFRPPPLVSEGSRLVVRFSANGDTARGFKMRYAFQDVRNILPQPSSDCGGFVTNFGGTITMANMSSLHRGGSIGVASYDCVWLLQPPQEYAFKSHLSIRAVQFDKMGTNSSLEIRQGLTSDDYLLERLQQDAGGDTIHKGEEHVVSFDTGFYVRLRGFFQPDSQLAIVYTSFSYLGSCYSLTDLKCRNRRCIPKLLRCDGFDHCGDQSDEPPSCYTRPGDVGGEEAPLTPKNPDWWYQHTPNYYFPYRNPLFSQQQGSGVLLLSSLFILVLVIVALIGYLIRTGGSEQGSARVHRPRRSNSLNDGVEIFDASADDPPMYEAPPDYEEVVKLILSGNNLKLVRRPGGMTAWVPNIENHSSPNTDGASISDLGPTLPTQDLLTPLDSEEFITEGATGLSVTSSPRPELVLRSPFKRGHEAWNGKSRRTRQTSLDLDQKMEVVIWDPNQASTSGATSAEFQGSAAGPSHSRYHPSTPPHLPSDLRRTSMQSPISSYRNSPDQVGIAMPDIVVNVMREDLPGGANAGPPLAPAETPATMELVPDGKLQTEYEARSPDEEGSKSTNGATALAAAGSARRSRKSFRKGKGRRSTKKRLAMIEKNGTKPPSYELVLKQVLEEFYITDEAYVIDNLQDNIAAQLRVRAAREKFQQLCVTSEQMSPEKLTKTKSTDDSSRYKTIIPGTVKRRKALLLNLKLSKCRCDGPCMCVNRGSFRDSSTKILYGSPKLGRNTTVDGGSHDDSEESNPRNVSKLSIARNNSTPSLGSLINRDLEIYFSQKAPSPTHDENVNIYKCLIIPDALELENSIDLMNESKCADNLNKSESIPTYSITFDNTGEMKIDTSHEEMMSGTDDEVDEVAKECDQVEGVGGPHGSPNSTEWLLPRASEDVDSYEGSKCYDLGSCITPKKVLLSQESQECLSGEWADPNNPYEPLTDADGNFGENLDAMEISRKRLYSTGAIPKQKKHKASTVATKSMIGEPFAERGYL